MAIFVLVFCFASSAQLDDARPQIIRDPYDKFGRLTANDLMARLDGFYIELQSEPKAEGIVVVEFNKQDMQKTKVNLLKLFDRAFNFRKFDTKRFTFFISQADREQTTLWIVWDQKILESKHVSKSDEQKVTIVKGENLRREIKRLLKTI